MSHRAQLWAFRAVLGVIALVTLVVGPFGGFGSAPARADGSWPRMARLRALVAVLAVASAAAGCAEMLRGYAVTQSDALLNPPPESAAWSDAEWGGYYALYGDFGSLTTDNLAVNAVPWKLVNALADAVPEPFYAGARYGFRPVAGEPLRRFGVIYGARLAGPAGLVQRSDWRELPVGYARGTVRRTFPDITLEIASTNCSMCHLGRTWDAAGLPTQDVWWGVPNHSIDFDALARAITQAALDPRANDDALLAAMARRYPQISEDESRTYRRYILPAFRKAIAAAEERWHSLHPWSFGGPGFSHGTAILRDLLADDKDALSPSDFLPASTKIPNLYGVTGKQWLLIDGSYEAIGAWSPRQRIIHHLVAFLPVFGTSVDRSIAELPRLGRVAAFLESIAPPPFPAPIDAAAAVRGAAHYAARCASCHGDRSADGAYHYPNRLVPVGAIGTDPTRVAALDDGLATGFGATKVGAYERFRRTGAYLPPPLRGIWASAPYFHNGSVPTLWHVLAPAERPARFLSGGHPFDAKRVGIACQLDAAQICGYAAGYTPWSEPRLYDTAERGRSNRGHDVVPDLSDADKWDLLEYLKTL